MTQVVDLIARIVGPLLFLPSLSCLLLTYTLAFMTFPLARRWLGSGPAAWAASRPLGLLLLAFPCWWLTQLSMGIIPWSAWILDAVFFFWLMGAAYGWIRHGKADRATMAMTPNRFTTILVGEAVFLASFTLALLLRMHAGGLIGQEKFMDLALLNSCISTPVLPPPDPWYYTGPINYYYGGYLIFGMVAKMTGAVPEVAYNLSLGLIFAMICQLVYALGLEGCRRIPWALATVVAVAWMSNLAPLIHHMASLAGAPHGAAGLNAYLWSPSRVIRDRLADGTFGETINEFPFFSFLVGDLHPHFMAIPFVLLFLLFLWRFARWSRTPGWRWSSPGPLGFGLVMAWLLGWLAFINGFDYLTFGMLAGVVIVSQGWTASAGGGRRWIRWLSPILFYAGLLMLSWLLFAPFHLHYHPPLKNPPIGLNHFHSRPGEFLTVWGIQLWAVGVFLAIRLIGVARRSPHRRWILTVFALLMGTSIALALQGLAVLGLMAIVAGSTLTLRVTAKPSNRDRFMLPLILVAALILGALEIFHLRDSYGDRLERMNSLFKFYYPCWLLLGVCVTYALREACRASGISPQARRALVTVAFILLLSGVEYPLVTSWARLSGAASANAGAPDLDGLQYLKREHPGDWGAIQWLRAHAHSGEVVLEAVGDPYTYHARIATHGPARAVLGWPNHQFVWRGQWPAPLVADVQRIYNHEDYQSVVPILKQYGVDYIMVGELERQNYSPRGLAKFRQALAVAYEDPAHGTILYRARPRLSDKNF